MQKLIVRIFYVQVEEPKLKFCINQTRCLKDIIKYYDVMS